MVKKVNGKWRMCVNFTNLNRACPKDSYPLSRIDTLVDLTARHQLLSFIDAFSGYNQIKMDEADQEKTSFVISQGLNCVRWIRSPEPEPNGYVLLNLMALNCVREQIRVLDKKYMTGSLVWMRSLVHGHEDD